MTAPQTRPVFKRQIQTTNTVTVPAYAAVMLTLAALSVVPVIQTAPIKHRRAPQTNQHKIIRQMNAHVTSGLVAMQIARVIPIANRNHPKPRAHVTSTGAVTKGVHATKSASANVTNITAVTKGVHAMLNVEAVVSTRLSSLNRVVQRRLI